MRRHFLACTIALVSFGCSGSALDVGSTDAGPASTNDGGSSGFVTVSGGGGDSGAGLATNPTTDSGSDDAPAVTTAKAVCAQNKGVDIITTGTDSQTPAGIAAMLVGRWYSCDAPLPSAMRLTIAIEFYADGTWKRWADDGAGGVKLAGGAEGNGTWQIFRSDGTFVAPTDTTPGSYPYIYINDTMGGQTPTSFSFNESPRFMYALESTSGLDSFLVTLP